MWQEHRDSATVRRFVGEAPASPIGRLALARIQIGEGNRTHAGSEVRAVWQSAQLSAELETAVLAAFPDVLTRADHLARMDRRIGAKDFSAAMRAAKRVGADKVGPSRRAWPRRENPTMGGHRSMLCAATRVTI